MNKPRLPIKNELADLINHLVEEMGGIGTNNNYENAKQMVDDAYISVFDNYSTETPGYTGKVMSVIWSSTPSFYQVFTWDVNKKLEHTNQDESFIVDETEEIL